MHTKASTAKRLTRSIMEKDRHEIDGDLVNGNLGMLGSARSTNTFSITLFLVN